jgi:hypothetical protein
MKRTATTVEDDLRNQADEAYYQSTGVTIVDDRGQGFFSDPIWNAHYQNAKANYMKQQSEYDKKATESRKSDAERGKSNLTKANSGARGADTITAGMDSIMSPSKNTGDQLGLNDHQIAGLRRILGA